VRIEKKTLLGGSTGAQILPLRGGCHGGSSSPAPYGALLRPPTPSAFVSPALLDQKPRNVTKVSARQILRSDLTRVTDPVVMDFPFTMPVHRQMLAKCRQARYHRFNAPRKSPSNSMRRVPLLVMVTGGCVRGGVCQDKSQHFPSRQVVY